jgi:hypothetical protein
VICLLTICAGLPFIVTEFGYPSSSPVRWRSRRGLAPKRTRYLTPGVTLTPDQQAERITQEWEFWRPYTESAQLYQINDGVHADEGYGIRACNADGTLGDWKPSAYTVPKGDPMADFPLANLIDNTIFLKADLVEVPGRAGEYGLRSSQPEMLLSPKDNGQHELRPMSYLGGPDETCREQNGLVYFPSKRVGWPLLAD